MTFEDHHIDTKSDRIPNFGGVRMNYLASIGSNCKQMTASCHDDVDVISL